VLSNLDKHRALSTVVSAVQHEGVGVARGVSIKWEKYATGQQLGVGETHVSTFIATSETELSEADLEPIFAYEVLIEGRRLDIFSAIVREVTPCWSSARPGSRCTHSPRTPSCGLGYRLGAHVQHVPADHAGAAAVVAGDRTVAPRRRPGLPTGRAARWR
jgi:hypothetical protein